MTPLNLEPPTARRAVTGHGERPADDAPTVPFRPLLHGELVLVVVPAVIVMAAADGRVLVELPELAGVRRPTRVWVARTEVDTPDTINPTR